MTCKLLPVLSSLVLILITACSSTQLVETKARIFERKLMENGKLMVCYSFKNGNALIQDSSVIENLVIIPQDSVSVVYQKNNPANSNLLLIPGN